MTILQSSYCGKSGPLIWPNQQSMIFFRNIIPLAKLNIFASATLTFDATGALTIYFILYLIMKNFQYDLKYSMV